MSKLGSIQGTSAGVGELLERLYNRSTNTYFVPYPVSFIDDTQNHWLVRTDSERKILSAKSLSNTKCAVLDTGMMKQHPLIKPYLKESVNFSQDFDVEDHNGHGTFVTLIYLLSSLLLSPHGAPDLTELYNVKVLNTKGNFLREDMIKAIEWCSTNHIGMANISAGIFTSKCKGDCELCTSARKANLIIFAAAGNEGPDKTVCPAKAGVFFTEGNVISTGKATSTGQPTEFSGRAQVYGLGDYTFVPVQELWNTKGIALHNLGKLERQDSFHEAILSYEEAIRIKPDFTYAWYNKGLALYNLGKHKEAIKCYDIAIKIDPNYADAWYNKGNALLKLGMYEDAIKSYEEAIRIKPDYVNAWNTKGSALHNLGKYDEAIECYDIAIKMMTNFAKLWNNKGLALYNLGKHKEAIKRYDIAIKIDPNYANPWDNKGLSLQSLGQQEDADRCFHKAYHEEEKKKREEERKRQEALNLFYPKTLESIPTAEDMQKMGNFTVSGKKRRLGALSQEWK